MFYISPPIVDNRTFIGANEQSLGNQEPGEYESPAREISRGFFFGDLTFAGRGTNKQIIAPQPRPCNKKSLIADVSG